MGLEGAVVPDESNADLAYLKARRLEHAEGLTATEFCKAIADKVEVEQGEGEIGPMLREAVLTKAKLGLAKLNALALLALRRGEWPIASELASEVVARDHHDLLAQRIFDAAALRTEFLDTPTDAWLADRVCTAPFEELETRENGDVHFCCSAWQPVPIGRLADGGRVWTSPRAEEIRRSVLDGDFSHCSRWHCPRIADRRLPRRKAGLPRPAPGPRRVILSHDRSCNLACPSCRTDKILLDRRGTARLDRLMNGALFQLVSGADTIKVTGAGDPFASRHFRRIIADLPRDPNRPRRLQLHTNGLLLDQRAWTELDLWDQVASVWVSIDAARAETYAELRGGDFGRLMDNLRFLGTMRRAGALPFLRLDAVVQRHNYAELPEIVDLANRIGADGVYLLRLRNWGTFDPDDFRARDVCHPDHSEHEQLLDRLADPRIGSPGVELGSLSPLVAAALARSSACAASS